MSEEKDNAAMRALFAAQDTPGEGPAFAARVAERVKADRAWTLVRVQVGTAALAAAGGVFLFPQMGPVTQQLISAFEKSMPALPALGGAGIMVIALAAAATAYFVAERA